MRVRMRTGHSALGVVATREHGGGVALLLVCIVVLMQNGERNGSVECAVKSRSHLPSSPCVCAWLPVGLGLPAVCLSFCLYSSVGCKVTKKCPWHHRGPPGPPTRIPPSEKEKRFPPGFFSPAGWVIWCRPAGS